MGPEPEKQKVAALLLAGLNYGPMQKAIRLAQHYEELRAQDKDRFEKASRLARVTVHSFEHWWEASDLDAAIQHYGA